MIKISWLLTTLPIHRIFKSLSKISIKIFSFNLTPTAYIILVDTKTVEIFSSCNFCLLIIIQSFFEIFDFFLTNRFKSAKVHDVYS